MSRGFQALLLALLVAFLLGPLAWVLSTSIKPADEILRLPPEGCVNVHAAPLPRYRGMLPTFWVLYEREPETAVTVHYMNEKLDDGPIILQESVPIREGETQRSLMRRCKIVGARLLSQTIDLVEMGEVRTRPNPREEATYH